MFNGFGSPWDYIFEAFVRLPPFKLFLRIVSLTWGVLRISRFQGRVIHDILTFEASEFQRLMFHDLLTFDLILGWILKSLGGQERQKVNKERASAGNGGEGDGGMEKEKKRLKQGARVQALMYNDSSARPQTGEEFYQKYNNTKIQKYKKYKTHKI